jgi:PleD family two-component response regulator
MDAFPMHMATKADLYDRISAAVRETVPGEPGDRLLARIVEELSIAAEQGGGEIEALVEGLSLEIERDATTDAVTGLPNRALLIGDLTRHIAAAVRHDEPVAVLVAKTKDSSGEQEERAVGEALLRLVRVSDVVARIAPGRFAVILPSTNAAGAVLVAARISELGGYGLVLGSAVRTRGTPTAGELLALAEVSLDERLSAG